jgi:hypothetical protein
MVTKTYFHPVQGAVRPELRHLGADLRQESQDPTQDPSRRQVLAGSR